MVLEKNIWKLVSEVYSLLWGYLDNSIYQEALPEKKIITLITLFILSYISETKKPSAIKLDDMLFLAIHLFPLSQNEKHAVLNIQVHHKIKHSINDLLL